MKYAGSHNIILCEKLKAPHIGKCVTSAHARYNRMHKAMNYVSRWSILNSFTELRQNQYDVINMDLKRNKVRLSGLDSSEDWVQ